MCLLEARDGVDRKESEMLIDNAFGEKFEQGHPDWPPSLFEFLAKGVFCYLELDDWRGI